MADYKRLVSYMYLYEEGKKRNNIGYARVETRNGQCKYNIHITALGLNEKQLKVYVFKRNSSGIEGVLLGSLLIRNNSGDFKIITDAAHIMNSPYGLDDMGGIILLFSDRKFFATEWDSKPITMSMVANIDKKSAVGKDNEKISGEEEIKAATLAETLFEHAKPSKDIIPERDTEEIEGDKSLKDLLTPNLNIVVDREEALIENKKQTLVEPKVNDEQESEPDNPAENTQEPATDNSSKVNQDEPEDIPLEENQKVSDNTSVDSKPQVNTSGKELTPSSPVFDDHPLAKQIYHNFPKMYPFEDNEIAWCARIEPKDIGMLPMDLWGLGNNSFLLHGYYSYRHLIFARVNDKNGQNYILGVPGIYHNREKFMAKMFGFENFKCAKRKPQRTGEFGYWYVPVLLNSQV